VDTLLFQSIPEDWQGRWRLLRRYAERLYGITLSDIGRIPPHARRLESKLDQRLPPTVIEWMAFTQDLLKASERAASDLAHYKLQAKEMAEQQATALNQAYEGRRWGVAYRDLGQDDPPVRSYTFVQRRNEYVVRPSHGRVPVTEFALHTLVHDGWSNFARIGSGLEDVDEFLATLPKSVAISEPFGSLRFIEGEKWIAVVQDGFSLCGQGKTVSLRFLPGTKLRDVPKPLRDRVGLKPTHLRARESWI
jgi:hypothetical protein